MSGGLQITKVLWLFFSSSSEHPVLSAPRGAGVQDGRALGPSPALPGQDTLGREAGMFPVARTTGQAAMADGLDPGFYLPWRRCEARRQPTMCNVARLLDRLQMEHQEDVRRLTDGHLNPARLFKPEPQLCHWHNAWRPRSEPGPGAEREAEQARLCRAAQRMTDALAYFTLHTALRPGPIPAVQAHDVPAPWAPRPGLAAETALPDARELWRGPAAVEDRHRQAGLTRTDRYRRLRAFRRGVQTAQDLGGADLRGRRAARELETKLDKALQGLCACRPPQLGRLQVFGEVFRDLCDGSLIFGDLLREVKEEYELYMAILLVTRPSDSGKMLLDQVRVLEKSPVQTKDIEKVREELRTLAKAARAAVEHNDKLKKDLEMEQRMLQSVKEEMKASEEYISNEDQLTLTEKVEKRRCEILDMWDKIQDLSKQLKTAWVHTGISNITVSGIKSLENEAERLETTNSILEKKSNAIESYVKSIIKKNTTGMEERKLLEFVEDYITLKEPKNPEDSQKVTTQNR
ncbi:uncharacterized protein C6orf118 homolog [Thomomys bottae]